jgi:hypothetical protein
VWRPLSSCQGGNHPHVMKEVQGSVHLGGGGGVAIKFDVHYILVIVHLSCSSKHQKKNKNTETLTAQVVIYSVQMDTPTLRRGVDFRRACKIRCLNCK